MLDRGPAGRFLPSPDPVDVRFWALVHGPWYAGIGLADCWPWLGATAGSRPPATWPKGARWKRYGRFRFEGRLEAAHRVALILAVGPAPAPDSIASHTVCDASLCCNPAHLKWDSQVGNMAEAAAKGRFARDRGRFVSTGMVAI